NAGPDQTVNEGDTVNFEGTGSTDPDGDRLQYFWAFDDGMTATGSTPSHAYADNGKYDVILTVDDGNGGGDSSTMTVIVNHGAPTVTIFGVPTRIPETYELGAMAAVSDPGSADTYTLAWQVTKDGVPFASGSGNFFVFTTGDDGTYVLDVTA